MILKRGVKRYFRLDVNSLTVDQRQTWYNRQILLLLNSARRVAKTDPAGDRRGPNEPASKPRLGGALALALCLLLASCAVCADEPVYIQDTGPVTNSFFVSNTFTIYREGGTNYEVGPIGWLEDPNEVVLDRLEAIDKRLRLLGYVCSAVLGVALIVAITLLVVIFHEDPDDP